MKTNKQNQKPKKKETKNQPNLQRRNKQETKKPNRKKTLTTKITHKYNYNV